jgi:acyl-CoA thioesterase-2
VADGVSELAELLDLVPSGHDTFVGPNGARRGVGDSVFGGQLVAQALRAAGAGVDGARPPHSLHGYFVRAARRDRPVRYVVERVRDGGTVSVRSVRGEQDGATVIVALASFKEREAGAVVDEVAGRHAPAPEDCEPIDWDVLLETRMVSGLALTPRIRLCDAMWVRSATPLPDDPLLQACALAYLSDLGSGFATLDEPDLPAGGPSLDHALWFHDPIRADAWVLVDHRPLRVADARGTYRGTLRDGAGRLGALLCQEVLLRMPSPYARPSP